MALYGTSTCLLCLSDALPRVQLMWGVTLFANNAKRLIGPDLKQLPLSGFHLVASLGGKCPSGRLDRRMDGGPPGDTGQRAQQILSTH